MHMILEVRSHDKSNSNVGKSAMQFILCCKYQFYKKYVNL